MKHCTSRRLLALALALALCLGLLPGTALAANQNGSDGIYIDENTPNNTTWECGDQGGTAEWSSTSQTLTLKGTGAITGRGDNFGIRLPGGAKLVVTANANWTVTGASVTTGSAQDGIYAEGDLTVTVSENASLKVTGGNSGNLYSGNGIFAVKALAVTVEHLGSLTSSGGHGRFGTSGIFGTGVTLDNRGTVTTKGGNDGSQGEGIYALDPGLMVDGSGILYCEGHNGITAQETSNGRPGSAAINGGTVVTLGKGNNGYGIDTTGGTLTMAADATVVSVGKNGSLYGSASGDGTFIRSAAEVDAIDPDPHASGLDLDGEPATFYSDVGGGTALWLPGRTNRLTLTGANITPGGVSLPAGETTLEFHEDNTVAGGVHLAQGASNALTLKGASTLTVENTAGPLFTGVAQVALDAPQTGWFATAEVTPERRSDYWGIPGTALPEGASGTYFPRSVDNVFVLEYQQRNSKNLLIVQNGYGGDAKSSDLRPAQCPIKFDSDNFYGWEFYDKDTGNSQGTSVNDATILMYTERNATVSIDANTYNATFYVRAITKDPTQPPTPPPAPPAPPADDDDDDGPAAYHVVYRPGYDGPQSVRAGGYEEGEQVTVRDNPFPAPQGQAFAGWSESETGPVKYRPGDVLTMPGKQVELYARWTGPAPALNREDHEAYLRGYADGTIRPEALITREQTAAIFYRLLDEASRERYHSAASPFPDVAAERWSAGAIAAMASAGILQGRRDGLFHPADPVTRAEFTAIAARLEPAAYDGPDLFTDTAGHWAAEAINRAAQAGWVKGGADGRFRPDAPITRAEAAVLLNRLLGRAPETAADLLPGMAVFTDNADPDAWYYLDIQEAANGHDYARKADGIHETWTALTDDPTA